MPTIASSPIVVQNIYIETVVTCKKFKVSCWYSFSNIPILLLVGNVVYVGVASHLFEIST